MTDFDRQDFVGGRLALDFTNTAAARDTELRESLKTPQDFIAWMRASGAYSTEMQKTFAAFAKDGKDSFAEFAARARSLRETIHRLFAELARRGRLDAGALRTITKVYRKTVQTAELTAHGNHAKLSWRKAPPEDLFLGPIVLDTVDLLETVDLSRLRQCHGVNCGWLFIDRSKGNRRRWCDMATCGNVSKARRYFRRRKELDL